MAQHWRHIIKKESGVCMFHQTHRDKSAPTADSWAPLSVTHTRESSKAAELIRGKISSVWDVPIHTLFNLSNYLGVIWAHTISPSFARPRQQHLYAHGNVAHDHVGSCSASHHGPTVQQPCVFVRFIQKKKKENGRADRCRPWYPAPPPPPPHQHLRLWC